MTITLTTLETVGVSLAVLTICVGAYAIGRIRGYHVGHADAELLGQSLGQAQDGLAAALTVTDTGESVDVEFDLAAYCEAVNADSLVARDNEGQTIVEGDPDDIFPDHP